MNNGRRKELKAMYEQVCEVKDSIEVCRDEEVEYRDNMPENLQGSEKYEKAEAACDALEEAISSLEEIMENLDAAME